MNNYNEINVILAGVDFIETESTAVRPGPQTELLGTVRPQTNDAENAESTDGVLQVGNGSRQVPSFYCANCEEKVHAWGMRLAMNSYEWL